MADRISDIWQSTAIEPKAISDNADQFGRVFVTHCRVGVSRDQEPVSEMVFVDEAVRQMQHG